MKKLILLVASFLIVISNGIFAEIKPNSLFSDNMILQQLDTVNIWGWAENEKEISIKPSWNNKIYTGETDKQGKWKIAIETPKAGGPYIVTIKGKEEIQFTNVLIGEVWLCSGQSNMEMPMMGFRGQPIEGGTMDILKSKNNNIRLITVPRKVSTVEKDNFNSAWKEATPSSVAEFSATAYYYGRLLNEMLDIPIGLICVSYGGSCVEAWMSHDNTFPFEDKPVPQVKDSINIDQRTPSTLFNGMLHPVIGYTIKGAIWYQGETNYINPDVYPERFASMVKEWRALWNQGEFPFYYVQIAPFDYSIFHTPNDSKTIYNSAYLREAQFKALDLIPNSQMAVILDYGNEKNIHPSQKQPVGERLALIALAETYGLEGFDYAPPKIKGTEIKESTFTISFDNIPNGITSYGKEVTNIEIAGENKIFYPAQVWVRSKSIVVSAPQVLKPVAVRYAFKDFTTAHLFSTGGIPVPSFRTDDW